MGVELRARCCIVGGGPAGMMLGLLLALRLLQWLPALRRIPARLVGIGFRPERVRYRS